MMSNGAPSTDAKSGDGGASRDGGRDRAMSRVGMSCDGAMSVGKASNGRTMTGGMTSGAATTTLGAVVASSDGTLSHSPHAAERWRDEPLQGERRPHHDGRHVERRGCNDRPSIGERERDLYDRRDDRSHDPRRDHDRRDRRGEGQPQHSDRRLSPPMRGAGSRDERHTSAAGGQLDAKQLSGRISHASGADELLRLFAAHSADLNHIHAANLWNKLGKQRIERRHERRLEQLVQRTLDLISSCRARELKP